MTVKPESLANLTPFKPGVSPNPGGKPVGTRDEINKRFLNALARDFNENGKEAIVAAREKDPMGYVKVLAGLLPKEIQITRPLEGISDDELAAIADRLRSELGAARLRVGTVDPQGSEAAH